VVLLLVPPGAPLSVAVDDSLFRRLLRDVDLEDGHDADLEDVWAVENPAGWVRRGWVVLRVSRAVLRVSR